MGSRIVCHLSQNREQVLPNQYSNNELDSMLSSYAIFMHGMAEAVPNANQPNEESYVMAPYEIYIEINSLLLFTELQYTLIKRGISSKTILVIGKTDYI